MDGRDRGLVILGRLLKALRLANNKMTQAHLARLIGCAEGTISGIETGQEWPARAFLGRIDTKLNTGGVLVEAYDYAKGTKFVHPVESFDQFRQLEQRSAEIYQYQLAVIPGLLQTEDYARALITAGTPNAEPDKIDDLVRGRMERQEILTRKPRPTLLLVIDESALRRQIGSREIHAAQLDHLMELTGKPGITVQLIPQSKGHHAGLVCSFTILGFNDGPSIAYTEDPACGHIHDQPSLVRWLWCTYDALRASALPIDESLRLIQKVREDI